jgi:hypothetical protein
MGPVHRLPGDLLHLAVLLFLLSLAVVDAAYNQ